MIPTKHAVIGFFVSIILYPIFGFWAALTIFLVNIFVDCDHVFGVWINEKKITFNLKKLYEGCMNLPEGPETIFHTAEIVLLITLISFMFSYYYVLIGIVIHLLTDYIDAPFRLGKHGRFWFSYLLAKKRKF